MKTLALIRNNRVDNVVLGDDDFIIMMISEYDNIIDITDLEIKPSPGDSYIQNEFISNTSDPELTADLEAPCFLIGTDEGFEPFKLSQYSVRFENGRVIIGCKSYDGAGLLYSLYKVLIDDAVVVNCFTVGSTPGHGKFSITWDDAQLLYDKLKQVRFI